MEAIEFYHPAIEIVDDRYVKWETMGAPTLVADDFFAAGCVLGKPVARFNAPNLLHVAGRAVINGKEVGRGTGADVLGHPHNALAWLANHLAAEGKGLHGADRVDGEPCEDGVAQGRRRRGDGARRVGASGGEVHVSPREVGTGACAAATLSLLPLRLPASSQPLKPPRLRTLP